MFWRKMLNNKTKLEILIVKSSQVVRSSFAKLFMELNKRKTWHYIMLSAMPGTFLRICQPGVKINREISIQPPQVFHLNTDKRGGGVGGGGGSEKTRWLPPPSHRNSCSRPFTRKNGIILTAKRSIYKEKSETRQEKVNLQLFLQRLYI